MLDLGSAVGYLMLDTSNFKNGFKSALSDLKVFQDRTASATDKTTALSGAMTSVGKTLTKSVTLPLVGIGTAAVATTAKFDSSMSNLQAISGATGNEMDTLRQKAIEMGGKTKFSASEAADAFTYMAMAGWKTGDMLNGIEGIMNLAAASGEDLASTSDIVTDALTAFGLSASDSAKFADVLAAASNNANTNVSMLGESFKYVAPVAGALGYSVEDTSIALGLMANSGIKASQAGTSLRGALSKMIKPTDDAAAMMEKYHISMFNADGSSKSLMGVMQNLRNVFGQNDIQIKKSDGTLKSYQDLMSEAAKGTMKLSDQQKLMALSTIFGTESLSGMLAIINASDADFNKLTESINNAGGTAQTMADTQLDNLTGQLTILKSTLETLAISIGTILMPYIREFVTWLQSIVERLNSASDSQKRFAVTVAAIAAAIGPILLIGGKIAGAIANLMKLGSIISGLFAEGGAFAGAGAAIAGLAGPIAIVIAAIVGLVAAWKTNFGHIHEYTSDAVESIKGIFESLKSIITGVASGAMGVLRSAWESDFLGIQEIVTFFGTTFENVFEQILDTIATALEIINQLLQGDFQGAFETFTSFLQGTWERIQEIFSTFGAAISEIWTQIWTTVSEFFKSIWDSIVQWIQEKITQIVQFFTITLPAGITAGIQFLSQVPGMVAEFMAQLPETIGYYIGLALGNMAAWAVQMAEKARETGTNVIQAIVQFFTQLPGKIANFCSQAWSQFTAWASNMWNKAKETGQNVLNGVVQFLQQLPGKIASVVSSALSRFQTFVTGLPQKARQGATEAKNAVVNGLQALPGMILSIGSQAVAGLWNGIKGALGALKSNIIGFCKSVVDGFKAGFGIHSPARKMIPVGENLDKGLIVGMKNLQGEVMKTVDDIANELTSRLNNISDQITLFSDIASLKYDLWEQTEGVGASVADKYDKKLEMLTEQQEAQEEQVKSTQIAYDKMVALYGENSTESMKLQKQLLEEQIAYQKLTASIKEANAARAEAYQQKQKDYEMMQRGEAILAASEYYGSADRAVKEVNAGTVVKEGDTYIFNSPKAIDPADAAKTLKKASKALASSFAVGAKVAGTNGAVVGAAAGAVSATLKALSAKKSKSK